LGHFWAINLGRFRFKRLCVFKSFVEPSTQREFWVLKTTAFFAVRQVKNQGGASPEALQSNTTIPAWFKSGFWLLLWALASSQQEMESKKRLHSLNQLPLCVEVCPS
jgi:hypothetical protein